MDFEYTKSGSIFNLHSYWTKQPLNPISYFINKYSKEGDIVLDPFCGTGMTGIACIQNNRNAILNDISVIARHISTGYTTNFYVEKNSHKIKKYFEQIQSRISDLYRTKCEQCGKEVNILFSIVGEQYIDNDGNLVPVGLHMFNAIQTNTVYSMPKKLSFNSFELIKLVYKCTCSSTKMYKNPSFQDLQTFNLKTYESLYYPQAEFFGNEPKRNIKKGITKVFQLFSPKNITALALLFHEIGQIKEPEIKQLFLFAFTSIIFNNSLMSRYRSYENTSIKMGTFYIPPIIKDGNVLNSFEKKLKNILNYNQDITAKSKSTIQISGESAHKLFSIPSDTIDLIYTDPPYTDVISYSELNIVWESWLGDITNTSDEMIVNKFQSKTIIDYNVQFKLFLDEAYRVLKETKYLILVFHHPSIIHWRHLQETIMCSNFIPVPSKLPYRIISKNKTASQHKTQKTSQCFLVFTLKKINSKKHKLITLNEQKYRSLLKDLRDEAIQNGYNTSSDIFDFTINKLFFKYEILSIPLI